MTEIDGFYMLVTLKPLLHLAKTQLFINGDFSMPLSNTDAETSAAEIAPKVRSLQRVGRSGARRVGDRLEISVPLAMKVTIG